MSELTRRLKLSFPTQIIIALALVESCREESQPEGRNLLHKSYVAVKLLK